MEIDIGHPLRSGPGVLVACLGGLPDQKRILKDPALNSEWAVGPATADQQRLV